VRLRKLGAPIAIANIPDLALAPAVARLATRSLYEKRIEMFNLHVEATASRHGLALIDLYAMSREVLSSRDDLFSADGFHPSAAGYQAWAERMVPHIEPLLGEEARP